MSTHQSLQKSANAKKKSDIKPIPAHSRPKGVVAQPKIESTLSNEEQLAQIRAKREASERMGSTIIIPESIHETPPPPPVQPKRTIGEPGDMYEQEADRVARQVVDEINAPPKIQPQVERYPMSVGELKPSPLDDHPVMKVQRYGTGGEMEASPDLESSIQRARGGGQPLDEGIRERMEGAFGADFSGVRVHTDGTSDQLNQSIQAKAFTTGQDVFFRKGAYEPGSRGGQELLAHELTHVVQQNGEAVQRHGARIEKGQAKPQNNPPHQSAKHQSQKKQSDRNPWHHSQWRGLTMAGTPAKPLANRRHHTGPHHGERTEPQMVRRSGVCQKKNGIGEAMGVKTRGEAVIQREDDIRKVNHVIGLELTFANEYTKRELREGIGITESFRTNYKELIKRWDAAIQNSYGDNIQYQRIEWRKPKKDIFKDTSPEEARFKFTHYGEGGEEKWWFNVSLDPGVLEVQTKPVKGSRYVSYDWIGDVVATFIFGLLGTLEIGNEKLTAAKGSGGGHINVNLEDTRVSKASDLVRLITLWSEVSEKLHQIENSLIEYTNTAATIGTPRYKRTPVKRKGKVLEYVANPGEVNAALEKIAVNNKDLHDAVEQLRNLFDLFPQIGIVDDNAEGKIGRSRSKNQKDLEADEKRIAVHNQALNVEHIIESERKEQRLEFRNIDAQANLLEIQKSILMVVTVIQAATEPDKQGTETRPLIEKLKGITAIDQPR